MDIRALKEEISKGFRTFKIFENGTEILTALESLEQAEKDLGGRVDALKKEEKALRETAAKSKDVIAKAEKTAGEIEKAANNKAASIITAANTKASEIIGNAQAQAQEITNSISGLKSQKVAAQNELDTLTGSVKTVKAELATLNGLKAEAAKALGIK